MIIVQIENNPNILLESSRLVLRRVEQEDRELLERLFCNEDMMHYFGGTWNPDQVKETLQEWHQQWGINNYWYGVLIRKDNSKAIGIAGFTENTNPDEPGIELSWFILPGQQEQGFATEITRGILEFVFDHLHGNRVFAETHPENISSNRVLEKSGFVNIGEQHRKYDYLPTFVKQVVWEYRCINWVKGSC